MIDKIKDLLCIGQLPKQRRRTRRLSCSLPVQVHVGNDLHPGLVQDMGLVGLRVQMSRKLKVGSLVGLRYEGYIKGYQGVERQVTCRVLWCRAKGDFFYCGLQYNDPKEMLEKSWIKACLKSLGLDPSRLRDVRTTIRVAAYLECRVDVDMGGTQPQQQTAYLVDLSEDGALVEVARDIAVGSQCFLEIVWPPLPLFRCPATVVRKEKPDKGIRQIGLHIAELNQADTKLLHRYLKSLMQEQRVRPQGTSALLNDVGSVPRKAR